MSIHEQVDRLDRAVQRLKNNVAEFDTVTDGEFLNDVQSALDAIWADGEREEAEIEIPLYEP